MVVWRQATDRVHAIRRIRQVIGCRRICKGRVGGRLPRLREGKQALADALFHLARAAERESAGAGL